ncbi:major facilitator superfamily transporter [Penicillium argentinense]|uniref:Major facilitator superfamily transporter n=1 Tax=Penicillium argentinense TaxID=1131581 RepID=A0A9W9K1C8_9EURO|nr:major facilitator superfamily transporter [Penicillium argentinense]KAJ5089071.1 major facilitator superfamily transporter [Penicillium argentinense]
MKIHHLKWLRKAHDRLRNKEAPTVTELTEMPTKDEAPAPVDTENNNPNIEDVDYVQENIRASCNTGMWCLIVLTMLASLFLFALDNTIVADIQAPIIARLSQVEKLVWLGVAFTLSGSATIAIWGKFYGIFSTKYLYLSSVFLFEVGSTVCGSAQTMNAMVVGRAIAGIGGAGMYLGCLTLLTITTSIRERPKYMSYTGITWGLGTVLGPVVGGAFAQNRHATWRWAFYINLVIGAAFALLWLWKLPRGDPQKNKTFWQKIQQIDFLGMVLNIGALVALIMAINFGGNLYAWSSGSEIALWVAGGVVLLLFALQQGFAFGTTKELRIFPADLLRKPLMWNLFTLMCCAATCVFVPTYYIPLYFQFVRGDTPLQAAVGLLPFIIPMVFMGLSNGAAMAKTGLYMPWYLGGGIFTAVGGGLMKIVDTIGENTATSKVYGFSALIGIGAGMFIQTGFSVAQAKAIGRESDASSFIALAQNIGITIALAISGTVFQNQALEKLQVLLPGQNREALRGALVGAGSGQLKQLPADVRKAAIHEIVNAMGHNYWLVVAAGCVAVAGALFMKPERIFVRSTAMG